MLEITLFINKKYQFFINNKTLILLYKIGQSNWIEYNNLILL